MSKQILNNDVAEPLTKKLIEDTLNEKIMWEKAEIDESVEIPKELQVPLTTARVDYHFTARLGEKIVCHFQHFNSLYWVWFVDENEGFAIFSSGLYSMPGFADGIISLAEAIRKVTYDESHIVDELEAYIKG